MTITDFLLNIVATNFLDPFVKGDLLPDGGGFIALAATIPVIDVLPLGGLALLLGVDRFMAEIRAATNLMSNVIATLVITRWAGTVDYKRAVRTLNGGPIEGERLEVSPALTETTRTGLAAAG